MSEKVTNETLAEMVGLNQTLLKEILGAQVVNVAFAIASAKEMKPFTNNKTIIDADLLDIAAKVVAKNGYDGFKNLVQYDDELNLTFGYLLEEEE